MRVLVADGTDYVDRVHKPYSYTVRGICASVFPNNHCDQFKGRSSAYPDSGVSNLVPDGMNAGNSFGGDFSVS